MRPSLNLAAPVGSSGDQYTQLGTVGPNSTGFAKAQALVQLTLARNGTLLKKRFVLEEVLGVGGMGTV